MATFTEINGRKGAKYRAQVRIFQSGKVVYSEARTFGKRWQDEQWGEKRDAGASSGRDAMLIYHVRRQIAQKVARANRRLTLVEVS